MRLAQVSVRESEFPIERGSIYNVNDIGAAWCFGAERHFGPLTDVNVLDSYDGLFVTMWKVKHPKEKRWLDIIYRFKEKYPNKLVILHQEAEADWILHRSSPDWESQKSIMNALADKVDIFLAHTTRSKYVYSLFVKMGKVYVWDTVQDIDKILPFRESHTSKSHMVGVSTYDGRANGIVGLGVASKVTNNLYHLNRTIYNDDRDSFVSNYFGVVPVDIPQTGWFEWLKHITKMYVYLHPMPAASAGRDTIACACLGIPVIGNKDLNPQKNLFPDLCVDVLDTPIMEILLRRLLDDFDFYSKVRLEALSKIDDYSVPSGILRANKILKDYLQK